MMGCNVRAAGRSWDTRERVTYSRRGPSPASVRFFKRKGYRRPATFHLSSGRAPGRLTINQISAASNNIKEKDLQSTTLSSIVQFFTRKMSTGAKFKQRSFLSVDLEGRKMILSRISAVGDNGLNSQRDAKGKG
jgi:hypothetical protein